MSLNPLLIRDRAPDLKFDEDSGFLQPLGINPSYRAEMTKRCNPQYRIFKNDLKKEI